MRKLTDNQLVLGIILILGGAFAIATQDIVIKLVSDRFVLWQIFVLRGVLTMPVLFLAAFVLKGQSGAIRQAFTFWPLLRGGLITAMLLGFYAAFPFVSVSALGAAIYTTPILVALLSAPLIGERVGAWGWFGVFVGFVGVLILLRPGSDSFSPWIIVPLLGAVLYAFSHIITRVKCSDLSMLSLAISHNAMLFLGGLLVTIALGFYPVDPIFAAKHPYLLGDWPRLDVTSWVALGFLTVIGSLAAVLIGGAYQKAPPSKVAVFEYSYLLYVIVLEALIFSIFPDLFSVTGALLIVIAGIVVLRRKS